MKSLKETHLAEWEVKRSRFLAYLVPMGEFEILQRSLKAEHPKANHIAWARREINEYHQVVEQANDDGEPRGCAGQPILNAMRGAGLVECGLLVVRYFSGIKLGTGGMIRAYGGAARAVIEEAKLYAWIPHLRLSFSSDYSTQRQIHYWLDRHGIRQREIHFEEAKILWNLEASEEQIDLFIQEAGRVIEILDHGSRGESKHEKKEYRLNQTAQ